jgi:hypothetical protein
MQRVSYSCVAFIATYLLGSIAISAESRSRPNECTNPLVGAWRFDSEVDTQSDGKVIASVSPNEKHGFIVYTADMYVSAVIMPSDRKWVLESATRPELAASADDGTAYAGRYEVDQATQTVTHIPNVSFEPVFEGKRLTRKFQIHGDTLELSGTYSSGGEIRVFSLRLLRMPAGAPVDSVLSK